MKKKLACAITAGALALSTVAVAPEASAAPTRGFTAPVARTPDPKNTNTTKPATNTKTDTSDSSSQAGEIIGFLALGAVLLGIFAFFSPYNQNRAWANAGK